ncbi:MAG: VTT domain-containing protein [Candidatus Doudnabacteria bacterium]|nr:VTT domain-containing protein [Candidatus Doudnabacteria bacterium]
MDSFLTTHLAEWGNFPYLLVFFGMLIEGNLTLFASGVLLSQGVFDPLPILLTTFAGAFAEDFLWYRLGFRVKQHTHRTAEWAAKITNSFSGHLKKKNFRTLLISNFVYGIHRAVLFRAGMEKFQSKKFFRNVAVSLLIWIALVGGLGYSAGASVGLLQEYFKFAQILLLVLVILFLLFERYVVSGRLRKRL